MYCKCLKSLNDENRKFRDTFLKTGISKYFENFREILKIFHFEIFYWVSQPQSRDNFAGRSEQSSFAKCHVLPASVLD